MWRFYVILFFYFIKQQRNQKLLSSWTRWYAIKCGRHNCKCDYLLGCFYGAAALLAMQSAVLATAIPSVCPSVWPSAISWYPIQMNEDRITRSSLWGSNNTLVFWYQQWLGATSPSTLNLRSKWPTPSEKRRVQPISAYNVSTVRASEKKFNYRE